MASPRVKSRRSHKSPVLISKLAGSSTLGSSREPPASHRHIPGRLMLRVISPAWAFVLLNQTRHDVIFPAREPPAGLAHAADVIVLGCQTEEYVEGPIGAPD